MPRPAIWVLWSLVGVAVAGDAPPRQLWGFKSPIDLDEFQARAKEFVSNSSKQIDSATNSQVVSILTGAQSLSQDGADITHAFWEAIQDGFINMKPLYEDVSAVFRAGNSPAMLSIILGANVHALYAFVLNLERSIRHLGKIASACLEVTEVMTEMTQVVADVEKHLRPDRRLTGTEDVVKGALAWSSRLVYPFQNDFDMYMEHFKDFKDRAEQASEQLSYVIKGPLSPVLKLHFQLPEKESQKPDEAEADQRRRLEEDEDQPSLLHNQHRYQKGLSKILPLWKKADDLRFNMCPQVYRLRSLCQTFKRRLELFVQGGGATTIGILDGVNAETRVESIEDSRLDSDDRCPSKEYAEVVGRRNVELTALERVEGIGMWFVTVSVAGGVMIACRVICRPRAKKSEGYRPAPDPLTFNK